MKHALKLASRGSYSASPNPMVGAILVNDGKIVGRGFHRYDLRKHAEVWAIENAKDKTNGATLYVNLEPCCHQGRTAPCCDQIIKSGIVHVVAAMKDPNPIVNGVGEQQLKEAGIQVIVGEEADESQKLNEAYNKFITTGLPFVTAKFATSLDGKIATNTGDSKWITSGPARREAHRIRAMSDAVIVGIGTVLTDDPQLTARDEADQPLEQQPLRVVIDSQGRIPPGARLLQEPGKTLIATAIVNEGESKAISGPRIETISIPDRSGTVDLKALLASLGQAGITNVMVEGGSAILGSLFDEHLVDKVIAFIAPVIIGGQQAKTSVSGLGAKTMEHALRLRNVSIQEIGPDIMVIGYPKPNSDQSE